MAILKMLALPLALVSLCTGQIKAAVAPADEAVPLETGSQSTGASLEYLRRVMDQFHNRFPVYDDANAGGNHFRVFAKIPDGEAAVTVTGAWPEAPHSGATSMRVEFRNVPGKSFGGIIFLNGVLPAGATAPQLNFGQIQGAGIDLTGATELTFWARGQQGSENITFFMGGVGRDPETGRETAPYPDSTPSVSTTVILTRDWKLYRLNLAGRDLHYILGGFGWACAAQANPNGAVFFLDDIQYELAPDARKARLEQPRFLASFTTAIPRNLTQPARDFDFVNRNVAHTYVNALALLAFLADGSEDSLRRARLIGEAFLYAMNHDRTYAGDRLRDAYSAGDLALPPGWMPNGRSGTVPIPGFFDENRQRFFEIEQGGISTGNEAWAMIALIALHRRNPDLRYLSAARRLGEFILTFRTERGKYQGFQGGLEDPEGVPKRRAWASTEHNQDIRAAFSLLSMASGETRWSSGTQHAGRFVEAMWDEKRGCFLSGTLDPQRRNQEGGQLPVDAQAWAVLSIPDILTRHRKLLDCAKRNHQTEDSGFSGFDFNEDRDGVWFEGTAHMAVAYHFASKPKQADEFRRTLAEAQSTPPFGDGFGLSAASRDRLSTGFGFSLYRRASTGTAAWNVFAQLGFNPFYATGASRSR